MYLQLEPLGQYAETAPFNCPKSSAIFKQACEVIADDLKKNKRRSNWIVRSSNALALLASKEKSIYPWQKKKLRRPQNIRVFAAIVPTPGTMGR